MRKYKEATLYLCDYLEDIIGADGEIDYPESTFADSVLGFSSHIQMRNKRVNNRSLGEEPQEAVPYFEVKIPISYALVALAKKDEDFFDYCSEICALNILHEMPLPEPLRLFAYEVLAGKQARPKRQARPRKKNWATKSLLWSLTLEVIEEFDLLLTRNDSSERYSACDAVAEALTVCGRKTNYSEIKNLMVHPDNTRLRLEFEASKNIMSRWWKVEPPQNALDPDYFDFWVKAAEADVLDILRAFSPPRK